MAETASPRILVTGGGGFIGANLVRAWTTAGHDVIAATHPSTDGWRLDGLTCRRLEVDLRDPVEIERMFTVVRPSVVVNTAAHGAYSWQTDLDRMLAINVHAVERMISMCVHSGTPLLHLGSSSEYGQQDHAPAETERVDPNSLYAVTKAAGTHLVSDAVRRMSLVGMTLRLYSVYGPWEAPGRLMPTLARCALDGLLPKLVDGSVARDFVHVDDVVAAATTWIERPFVREDVSVLNLGSGRQTTIAELVGIVRSTCGITAEPVWGSMPNRRWDTASWVADPNAARRMLGWAANTTLEAGFAGLVAFVSSHRERYEPG